MPPSRGLFAAPWALLEAYQIALRERKWATNMATGGTLMFIADSVAQRIELGRNPDQRYDPTRTMVMVSWGIVGDAPINLFYFRATEVVFGWFNVPARASLFLSMFKGVAINLSSSVVRNPVFMAYGSTMSQIASNVEQDRPVTHNWQGVRDKLKRQYSNDLLPVLVNSLLLWGPINTFTFWKIPPHLRVVFTTTTGAVWLTYLVLVQHKDPIKEATANTAIR